MLSLSEVLGLMALVGSIMMSVGSIIDHLSGVERDNIAQLGVAILLLAIGIVVVVQK